MAEARAERAAAPGYEQARDELISVVRQLEAGGSTLEESLALWERGEELAKVCRQWLNGARERLDAALAEGAGEDAKEEPDEEPEEDEPDDEDEEDTPDDDL